MQIMCDCHTNAKQAVIFISAHTSERISERSAAVDLVSLDGGVGNRGTSVGGGLSTVQMSRI